MNMYVGLTDFDWYTEIKEKKFDEVNFWRPGTSNFKVLQPNDMFLFKLKKPYYAIVGGAFFVGYSLMPIDVVWDTFAEKNGTKNKEDFYNRINKYKQKNGMDEKNPYIGCIILTEPFLFEEKDWIKPMGDWSGSIVQGKKYDITIGEGKRVFEEVENRLSGKIRVEVANDSNSTNRLATYYESLTKHRIGQSAFRVVVTDAYSRECAVTGETALPVLQAAHIKAFSDNGPNEVNNGILLRSDIHTLFDRGYMTIDSNYNIEISSRLKEDYGNTLGYQQYHGKKLRVLPLEGENKPCKDYLQWHNENVFKG